MSNLNQIQALEQKVIKAVELINRLRDENESLRARVKSAQPKIQELESMVNTYKQEQDAIEKGILKVLSKLDKLEDEVSVSGQAPNKDSPRTVLRSDNDAPDESAAPLPAAPKPKAGDSTRPQSAGKSGQPPAADKGNELDIF